MEGSQLGLAIGLSLAGFFVLIVTIIILILLRKRKSSKKASTEYNGNEDSRKSIESNRYGSSNSSTYINPVGINDIKGDSPSKIWNSKTNLTQQFSGAQQHRLPRQPFESTPSDGSTKTPSQQSTLEVHAPQKSRDHQKLAETPSGDFSVLRYSNGVPVKSLHPRPKNELIVEEEWKSTVDEIFNSALSIHEHENRASLYPNRH